MNPNVRSGSSEFWGVRTRSGGLQPGLLQLPAPNPFLSDVAHRLSAAVFNPRHKVTVKLEISAANCSQKSPDVLSIAIACSDGSIRRDLIFVPIE